MSHIVVCDDELHIVRPLQISLERAGHRVSVAFDGEEAWEILQSEGADLLITDLQMPRLNGLELCGRLRETPTLREIPTILLTGKSFELSADEVRSKWGIRALIDKPFSPKLVKQRVENLLAEVAQSSS